jgi:hypothetical protein
LSEVLGRSCRAEIADVLSCRRIHAIFAGAAEAATGASDHDRVVQRIMMFRRVLSPGTQFFD